MERLNSGDQKNCLRNHFGNSQHWSDEMWKSKMQGGGGNKKRFQYCTDPSGQEILYLRALQGHSGRNLIDLALQDNVLLPDNFFEYIYHTGCAISLTSITNSGLKVYVSPRPPPKISFKDNWMKELDSEIPKTKNPIIKNGETRG